MAAYALKPRQILIAGRLMWTLWVLGAVRFLIWDLGAGIVSSQPGLVMRTAQFVVAMSLIGLLIHHVLLGRYWARIAYALLVCVTIFAMGVVLEVKQPAAWVIAGAIVLVAAYCVVLWLLFHPASAPWFQRSRRA